MKVPHPGQSGDAPPDLRYVLHKDDCCVTIDVHVTALESEQRLPRNLA